MNIFSKKNRELSPLEHPNDKINLEAAIEHMRRIWTSPDTRTEVLGSEYANVITNDLPVEQRQKILDWLNDWLKGISDNLFVKSLKEWTSLQQISLDNCRKWEAEEAAVQTLLDILPKPPYTKLNK